MSVTTMAWRMTRATSQISVASATVKSRQSIINYAPNRGLKMYKEKLIRLMYWRGRSFDRVKYEERKRSEFQDWNYKTELYAFSRRLQENVSEDTLRRIFTNPSYVNSLKKDGGEFDLPLVQLDTNEELVNKGMKLLDDCIKPYLRHHFNNLPEEGIIAITNYLKSEKVLADIAKWIGCKDIILTGEYPPSSQTMANAVPAVVAGIENDLGFDRAQRFIFDMIVSYINDIPIPERIWSIPHPKETLNLLLANSQMSAYEPRIIFQTGVKTLEACHVVGVYSDKLFLGSSPGETLDIAEECACYDALLRIFDLKDYRRPLTYGEKSEKIDYSQHRKPHESMKNWKFTMTNQYLASDEQKLFIQT